MTSSLNFGPLTVFISCRNLVVKRLSRERGIRDAADLESKAGSFSWPPEGENCHWDL